MASKKLPSDAEMERFFRRTIMKENAIQVTLMSVSDGTEFVVFTWDLPKDIGELDMRGLLDDVYSYAQNDVDGNGEAKRFVLVAEDDEKEAVGRSQTFELEPTPHPEDEEEDDEDDEEEDEEPERRPRVEFEPRRGPGGRPALPQLSESAQVVQILERTNTALMRHLEGQHRLGTQGFTQVQSVTERMMNRLVAANEFMSSKFGELLTNMEKMYSFQQERDLQALRDKKSEDRKDQAIGAFMQLLPVLQMKLLPGLVPGSSADPRIAALNEFLASVDMDKLIPALSQVVPPAQMAAFMAVLQTFQEQAAAEEAAAANGQVPAEEPPQEESGPNGAH